MSSMDDEEIEFTEDMAETARLLTLLCYGFNRSIILGPLYEFILVNIAREGGVSEETVAMILEHCHLPQSPHVGVLQ